MDPLVEKHRSEILALAHKHDLHNIRLFGSRARGEAHADSDVDLLVTLAPNTDGLAIFSLEIDVRELLGCPVDVLTEGFVHHMLRDRVLREAIAL